MAPGVCARVACGPTLPCIGGKTTVAPRSADRVSGFITRRVPQPSSRYGRQHNETATHDIDEITEQTRPWRHHVTYRAWRVQPCCPTNPITGSPGEQRDHQREQTSGIHLRSASIRAAPAPGPGA